MSLFIVETALQNRLILPVVLNSVYASFHTCFVISEPLAILCSFKASHGSIVRGNFPQRAERQGARAITAPQRPSAS